MHRLLPLAVLLALVAPALAQKEDEPPPKLPGVQVTFLPPPMEGTISLGVFARDGRLVRTLRMEASPEKDFVVGLNGLILQWDGNDDAGHPAPNGRYFFRGYAVGAMPVTGEAFHGNDWIADEQSPRVKEVLSLKALDAGRLQIRARLADDSAATLQCDAEGHIGKGADDEPDKTESGNGAQDLLKGEAGALPNLGKPRDACLGVAGSIWVIDETPAGVEVKQYSAKKEFIRRLVTEPGEPPPRQIAASQTDERIYLLDAGPGVQRVRGLMLDATTAAEAGAGSASTWKTFLSREIVTAESFGAFAGHLKRPEFKPEEKLHVRLVPNPLLKDAAGSIDLQIGTDAQGSLLRTADGLGLIRLTETPHLGWAVLGHEGKSKSVTFFQSDGAVVEEFRINQAANMMGFDAGEYELKR